MNCWKKSVVLASVMLLLTCHAASAENDSIGFQQKVLSIPTLLTGAFLIDREGFMWIGTGGLGVYRYDGYETKSFLRGWEGEFIGAIVEDNDGDIWTSSITKGLIRYNKNTGLERRYRHRQGDSNSLCSDSLAESSQALIVSKSNILWVGTSDAGLCEYDVAADTWTHHRHNPTNPNSLSDNSVLAITEDEAGAIWVGTKHGGLNRFDRHSNRWTHYRHRPRDASSLSGNSIRSLLVDSEGVLWVGTTDAGLNKLNRDNGTFSRFVYAENNIQSIGSDGIWSITEDSAGGIWVSHVISSNSGLSLLNKDRSLFTRFAHDPINLNSIGSNSVAQIYQDSHSDTLWALNSQGSIDRAGEDVGMFRRWRGDISTSSENMLSDRLMSNIIEDGDGLMWAGTLGGGLNRIDRTTATVRHFLPDQSDPLSIPHARITALAEDKSGVLWIGFWNGILASFDRQTGRCITIYRHNPDDPASIGESQMVKFILPDRDDPNTLWLASIGGGLDKFDKQKGAFSHYRPGANNSLSNDSLVSLYDDGKGVLWIATFGGGLDALDKKTGVFSHYRHQEDDPFSIGSDEVYEIIETRRGQLWISRMGGISRFDRDAGRFRNFDKDSDGVSYGPIGSMLEDGKGYLWLGTRRGLVQFDPALETSKRFSEIDGIENTSIHWTSRVRTKDGELWFGGSDGITHFYPADLRENTHVPAIVLTAFTQSGQVLDVGVAPERLSEVRLDWSNNYFEFQFAALNFTLPGKNRYAYKLEGWDEQWYEAGANPFGRYSGLAAGHYTLRLKGANNDGLWNQEGVSIAVIVKAPFWSTNWFYSLLMLLGMAIALLITFYVVRLRTEVGQRTVAQQALQESEEKFRLILDNSRDLLYKINLKTGEYEYLSPAIESMTGCSIEDYLAGGIEYAISRIHPEDKIRVRAYLDGSYSHQFTSTIEYRHRNPRLGYRWFSDNRATIFDEDQTAISMVGNIRDITESRKIYESLLENEARLQAILNYSPVLILTQDLDGNITSVNRQFELIADDPQITFVGKQFPDLFPDSAVDPVWRQGLQSRSDHFEAEEKFTHKDGVLHDYLTYAFPLIGKDNILVGTGMISMNITGRKQAENSLRRIQKMDALGQLTGGIAHDFNNLLGIIQGTAELIERFPGNDSSREWIKSIIATTHRAGELTKQLLGFSRRHISSVEPIDINQAIEALGTMISRSLTPDIKVDQQLGIGLWHTEINRGDFQDALVNLTINARDAMLGKGTLSIETTNERLDKHFCDLHAGLEPGEYVCLIVSDSGEGIAPDIRERVFEPFFTTKSQGEGTGLGLAMVFGFVQRSRGHISVYSELGIGTSFNLYLPRTVEPNTTTELAPRAEQTRGGTETILIVDDELGLRDIAQTVLESLGYTVLVAEGPPQALEILTQEPVIDLLFSDVIMPGDLDGYQLAKLATGINTKLKILFTSGYTDKAISNSGQERFDAELLRKPYSLTDLASRVRQVLDS